MSSANQGEPQATKERTKQQRPGRACDTCRRRKVRCEGGGPATEPGEVDQSCTLCVAQGIACTYEQRTTKRGPPKGYVESLERRLEAMEALLAQFAGKEGQTPNRGDSTETPPHHERAASEADDGGLFPLVATPGSSSSSAVQPQTGLDAIDELSMKLNDLNVEQNRYIGRGSGLHLVRSMQEYAEPSSTSILDNVAPSSVEMLLREEHELCFKKDNTPLPSDQLAKRLIDAAFNDFQVRWIIPRAFFDDCVRRGMIASDPSFKGLYLAILALGSRAVPNTMDTARDPTETRIIEGWTWFKAALTASESPLESATLFSLLRTNVLAIWQLGAAGYVSSWSTVGWAIRQAIDVGAHSEERADWNLSPLRNQLRKRAFYLLVALDYYTSANLGRPFAIQEEDWDVTPPLGISDEDLLEWDRQTSLARLHGRPLPPQPHTSSESTIPGSPTIPVHAGGYPWASAMSLYSLMARTMKSLYGMRRDKTLKGTKEAVRDLDSRLNAWLENVPAHVRWNPGQQDDETLLLSASLYSGYYSTQILVHREFISPSRSNALGFPSLAIVSNCARSCAHVLDTIRQRKLLHRAFSWAPIIAVQNAWVLLLGRFASPDPNAQLTPSAAADVKRCINVLHDLAPTTYLALKCYEGIVRLASLVTAPPSARRATNPLSTSSNKRAADWTDGQSPTGSQSDRPSPSASGDSYPPGGSSVDSNANKQRKLHENSTCRAMPLPLSTSDLSSSTFKGRATFAAEAAASTSTASSGPTIAKRAGDPFYNNDISIGAGADSLNIPTSYPDIFSPVAPTTISPSHYASSGLPNLSDLTSLPNAPYPQTSLPSEFPTHESLYSNLPDPLASSSLPVGGGPGNGLESFDLGDDFFALTSSSAANKSAVVNDPHVPADVNRAASEVWQTFSGITPMSLEDPTGAGFGGGGGVGGSWNVVGGADPFGNIPGGISANGLDPFSNWNFASPSDQTPRNEVPNNQWNYYDSNAFGTTS